jgi:transposase
MGKRFLEDCLAKGMSLEAIGELAGKHPSTVSYWLKKYGLAAHSANRHAPKGALDKEQLEGLIAAGLTLREIAERLDRSVATVRHWMGRFRAENGPSSSLASGGRCLQGPDVLPTSRGHDVRSRGSWLLSLWTLQV